MKDNFLGDALTKRPNTRHAAKFERDGGNAVTLEGVNVSATNNKGPGSYSTTDFPGDAFERMRRFALVLAKYSVPDTPKLAKKYGVMNESFVSANRVISTLAFKTLFREDATKDTVNTAPYTQGFKADATNPKMIAAALAFAGTAAMTRIINEVAAFRKPVADALLEANTEIVEWLGYYGITAANYLHDKHRHRQRYAVDLYTQLAHLIERQSETISRAGKKRGDKRKQPPRPVPPTKSKRRITREIENPEDAWATPYLVKHPLDIPHTGKLGRRLIAWNEGKQPKAFYRQVTDPQRRIFKRKTRALGGVVVFDCSGSMGLDDEDIKQVMRAAAGCSILCYSASGSEETDARNGNIHLVARNGRQTRSLPDFPGGNGVDLPALKWAYDNLRLNSKSPVIWVSDGGVTGKGDTSSLELRIMTDKYIKAKNIRQVLNPAEAIKLLTQLQARRMK